MLSMSPSVSIHLPTKVFMSNLKCSYLNLLTQLSFCGNSLAFYELALKLKERYPLRDTCKITLAVQQDSMVLKLPTVTTIIFVVIDHFLPRSQCLKTREYLKISGFHQFRHIEFSRFKLSGKLNHTQRFEWSFVQDP